MKKVININFQGRVIPIEETACDLLQNYTNSLRNYFANEEGKDEIINDIENRIAELFSEMLKKGTACITDADVQRVIQSMGRPEDFDDADNNTGGQQQKSSSGSAQAEASYASNTSGARKRLYRDDEDRLLGGVASGLANYLNLDPAIIRIIFALLVILGGSGFVIYIILWVVLPSRSLQTNIRKRLYRDADDAVIAGVAGGLAKYFDISPAIPRIIFAAPFIFGIITSIGRNLFDQGFVVVGGSGGGTFILAYIILWLVLPEAKTTAEKLEMKGEKVDLNSIRNTVMEDLQGMKGRAEKVGEELKVGAERFSEEAKAAWESKGKPFVAETAQAARRNSRGLGNAIALLVKAFIFFIGAAIALALFVGLISILGTGVGFMPLKDFLLESRTQQFLAWGTILLFVAVPVVAFIVWLIRRFMRVKSGNKIIGFSFGALWTVGWVFVTFFVASISRSFSSQVGKREDVAMLQPNTNKLLVKVSDKFVTHYDGWFELDGVLSADADSLYLNTVRVNVVKSSDNFYRVHLVKMSKGSNRSSAEMRANKISFPVDISNGVLTIPDAFSVGKSEKWRNQKVLIIIEVPVGKQIRLDDRVNDYEYFNIDFGRRRNWRIDWDRNWEDGSYWIADRDLLMTEDEGLQWDDPNRIKKDDGEPPANSANTDTTNTPLQPAQPTIPDSSKRDPYRYSPTTNPTTYQHQNRSGTSFSQAFSNDDEYAEATTTRKLSLPSAKLLANPLSIFHIR
ncbi:MAG: PspC domain-containing protein [Bacteroidetes bacterium]|nr:MAG: PspC domain-containing protein [Bacteroidota bacterium]